MADRQRKAVLERIREKIRTFPAEPGLYFMKDGRDTVLYIGKAKNLRSRAGSYFQPGADIAGSRGPKIVEMLEKVADVDFLQTASEIDAILQEARLIKDIRPPYNTDLIDDKSFPYLEITTADDYPGVYITRNPSSSKSRLFGPFTSSGDLRAALVVMQKIFKFRTCKLEIKAADEKRRFFRPCLLYSIKQCTAPCADRISREDYSQLIKDVVKFLKSKRTVVIRDLKRQMKMASENLDFETAAKLRDRIRLIERLDQRGDVDQHVQPEVFAGDPAEANEKLQAIFKSEQPIRVVEGFDIAHLAGTATVASCVQFIDGRPFKNGYRRFKIRTVKGIDDYASMKEVLSRRYRKAIEGQELWPDLVLIDGGIGQLHAAEDVFRELKAPMPRLASIAKKEEIIYISGRIDRPLVLAANSPVRKLFQYIRDEAHRFAQHYHHLLRSKQFLDEQ